MSLTAVIPLKALSTAKGRLSGAMGPDDRQAFVAWMARRVIAACRSCDAVTDILVVAGDEAAAAVATACGVRALVVHEPGLDAAMAAADAATAGAGASVVIAADLPEVTPADIAAVAAAAGADGAPAVVIAPTHDGGTGALLRRPPTIITTAYGPASADRHRQYALRAGIVPTMVTRHALSADVDTPEQLPGALALAADHHVGCDPLGQPHTWTPQ